MTPLTSLILTSYNQSHYLREAIATILAQTETNFELLIWDDGSTDLPVANLTFGLNFGDRLNRSRIRFLDKLLRWGSSIGLLDWFLPVSIADNVKAYFNLKYWEFPDISVTFYEVSARSFLDEIFPGWRLGIFPYIFESDG